MKRAIRRRSQARADRFDIAEYIVRLLNTEQSGDFDKTLQAELHRMVSLWIESGPHIGRLMRDHPGLIPEKVECRIEPTRGGLLRVKFFAADIVTGEPSPDQLALMLFLQLLTAPDGERLGGPCACGCQMYFLRESRHEKIFLPGHGSAMYAKEAGKKRHAKQKAPRIKAVKDAIAQWERRRVRGDWKVWVASEARVPVSTLGRWVNTGEIQVPRSSGR